ncbi:hypothetical protein [uncultured Maribacter sp.]|uniref:hypothetical protein n=1 Tax=uncultured Maribacter sp. TaxID=431308 RepID=UPI0030EC74AB|tara:strand:+ start:20617 stop:20832 length:216 start_codon:yes stop_codon:yes gene_type:complete
MVEGIYLYDIFEIDKGTYELVNMKIEHINSAKDFAVGLTFKNVDDPKDMFTEKASTFLSLPHKKIKVLIND